MTAEIVRFPKRHRKSRDPEQEALAEELAACEYLSRTLEILDRIVWSLGRAEARSVEAWQGRVLKIITPETTTPANRGKPPTIHVVNLDAGG